VLGGVDACLPKRLEGAKENAEDKTKGHTAKETTWLSGPMPKPERKTRDHEGPLEHQEMGGK